MRAFIPLILVLVFSCAENRATDSKKYFDFEKLVDDQISVLTDRGASVNKAAVVGEKKDESRFTPDSIGWTYELEIFRHLDVINKPVYVNAFDIEDIKDANSNLSVRSYKSTRDVQVAEVNFYYQDTFNKLRKITAVTRENTSLYTTTRNLEMQFDIDHDGILLTGYSIKGTQKLILNDTVNFLIQSMIEF